MTRIAVAGGRGLGFLLATGLSRADNAYNVVVLSRTPRREYTPLGIQVHVVNYHNLDSLCFALQGIDLIISTVSGQEQLNLINAASRAHIRYFVPSEFEGCLDRRPPARRDPLNRGSAEALALLRQWRESSPMKFTVFSCGIIMERFHPLGLGSYNMGAGEGVDSVGSYLMDINAGVVNCAQYDAQGRAVKLCLTSVHDLVRFIIAAVDLGPSNWPKEYRLRGDRLTIKDIVDSVIEDQ
ncbi:hypothetical protein K4F52_009177 [Lecanicillium sp. MT-2017a]|nr:hypothetical protein K4F52_009177 [Lecanicillium sp. MT-2017a]